MGDDHIFDLADVEALGARFDQGEVHWATIPEPWRRAHAATVVRWFTAGGDQDECTQTHHETYMRWAVERLANSAVKPWSVLSDRVARTERAYAAFLDERSKRPKDGPLFSPLEAAWLVLNDAGPSFRDHAIREDTAYWVDDRPTTPLHARWRVLHPDLDYDWPAPLQP